MLSDHARVIVVLVVLLICAACSSSGDGGSAEPAPDAEDAPALEADTSPTTAATSTTEAVASAAEEPTSEAPGPDSGDISYLFDQNEVRTYDITVSEENLATIDANPAAEEWVEAALEFEGDKFGPIGLRYKGSIGAWLNCLEGTQNADFDNPLAFFNPSGAKVCPKLSMKLKINWEDSKDEMYGVRTIQLHSMNNDPSQLRERLGYWLFNEAGAPAPRAVHARVNINGEYAGLFLLVEQLDGRFTRDRFDDGKGNLFKQIWPVSSGGQPQPEDALVAALRTNEDEASVELMSEFSAELAAASPEEAVEVVERWIDIDELIANQVVDRLIRHDDGPSNWRCFGGDGNCMLNNFYWYMDPTNRTAHLIAWDLDVTLDSIEHPLVQVNSAWGEIRNDCESFDIGIGFVRQRSATCDPLFGALLTHSDRYQAKLDELASGPYSAEAVEERLATWSAQIEDATAEAHEAFGDEALSVEEWRSATETLLDIIDEARTEVVAAAENLPG